MKTMFTRLMEADPGAGGGGGDVTYTFAAGADGVALPAEQVTALTATAKELGLTAEQATKAQASLVKFTTPAQVQVPEKYTFAQVDGKDLPAEIATELSATAKALGLTQEQAQAFAAHELKLRADAATEQKSAIAKVQDGWKNQIKADAELSKPETAAASKAALEKFFPDIAKDSAGFPFLDHPAVFKGLATIGKLIGPDGDFVRQSGKGGDANDTAKAFFPNMK